MIDCKFSGIPFLESNFRGAVLSRVSFNNCYFFSALFGSTAIAALGKYRKAKRSFKPASLNSVAFKDCDISSANFKRVKMDQVKIVSRSTERAEGEFPMIMDEARKVNDDDNVHP